ncbi:nuclear transport factor 2 family protein [Caulobacter vibrioides]|uniref:nuclear transport factor 2 family protein n=1 Tax=Caulobacter vibrioides TaxID=155892 RepID=UPI000BB4EB70|nr:nuclear transport factor 2 family protein [Caulobacter vibrioides]ATC25312.1 nuclear transport factor 2 family protein [Caulobacter vibrioides]AZH13401.1 nuclear transport factor 2 family protein [Caulobacter vibrioides]PLR14076.1 nuclear transport factor 2 family protein [Caulobacter vibrioides]
MSQIDYVAFAQRFVAAIQAGDAEAVRAFYAPDAKIWHNIDHIEQTVDQNLKSLAWFVRTLPDRTYRVQRIAPLPDGFVQQHVLEATLPNGERWAMDACVVVRVENGKITRLDEYLDSAKTAQLVAATR